MTNIIEQRKFFKEIYGRNAPDNKTIKWLTNQYDKAQDLLVNSEKIGYKGAFEMKKIKAFIRRKSIGYNFKKTDVGYRKTIEHLLSDHWQMESKVNPENDSAVITSRHMIDGKADEYVLPDTMSPEERKEYPLKLKDELTPRFKEQMNRRIIPHMRMRNYDTDAKERFIMILKMKNNEGEERIRNVRTKPIDVRIKSGKDRDKFFKRIDDEWSGVYRRFTTENILKNIDEDVLNPEVKMNREYYQDNNSWDYWYIYSISSLSIEIQFPLARIIQLTKHRF